MLLMTIVRSISFLIIFCATNLAAQPLSERKFLELKRTIIETYGTYVRLEPELITGLGKVDMSAPDAFINDPWRHLEMTPLELDSLPDRLQADFEVVETCRVALIQFKWLWKLSREVSSPKDPRFVSDASDYLEIIQDCEKLMKRKAPANVFRRQMTIFIEEQAAQKGRKQPN